MKEVKLAWRRALACETGRVIWRMSPAGDDEVVDETEMELEVSQEVTAVRVSVVGFMYDSTFDLCAST